MNTTYRKYLVLLLFLVLAPATLLGQKQADYLALKDFFRRYEELFMGLSAETSEFSVTYRETAFRRLFLNENVPVINFLDELAASPIPLSEFLIQMREFHEKYALSRISLENFHIVSQKRNGIVNVRLTQVLQYSVTDFLKYDDVPVYRQSDIHITLLHTITGMKIIRMEEAGYALVSGPGGNSFLPESIHLDPAIQMSMISNSQYGFVNPMSHPSAGFQFQLNYPVFGARQFQFFISPGFQYLRVNNTLGIDNLQMEIPGYLDKDGDVFDLLISGNNLRHGVEIDYIGVPLDFAGIWHSGAFSYSAGFGVRYLYPVKTHFDLKEVNMSYAGRYQYSGQSFVLRDIQRYGYSSYLDPESFSGVFGPDPNHLFMGNLHAMAGRQLHPKLMLWAGPVFRFSFNNLIRDNTPETQLIAPGGVLSPNLLSLGGSNSLANLGFHIRLSYTLKRPNLPYLKNVQASAIRKEPRIKPTRMEISEPPLNLFYINPFTENIVGKNPDHQLFVLAVEDLIARNTLAREAESMAYVAFGDTLFALSDREANTAFVQSLYRNRGVSHHIYADYENFADSVMVAGKPINFGKRQVNVHFVMASPYSHDDAIRFIDRFAREKIKSNYRNTRFYFYSPVLPLHLERSQRKVEERDYLLDKLLNNMEGEQLSPYNFDIIYRKLY